MLFPMFSKDCPDCALFAKLAVILCILDRISVAGSAALIDFSAKLQDVSLML